CEPREPGGGKNLTRIRKQLGKHSGGQHKGHQHNPRCDHRYRSITQAPVQQTDGNESRQWQQRNNPYRLVSYHFSLLSTSISVVFILLYMTVRMAKPTATSAAATAMIKKTNTCPAVSP